MIFNQYVIHFTYVKIETDVLPHSQQQESQGNERLGKASPIPPGGEGQALCQAVGGEAKAHEKGQQQPLLHLLAAEAVRGSDQ